MCATFDINTGCDSSRMMESKRLAMCKFKHEDFLAQKHFLSSNLFKERSSLEMNPFERESSSLRNGINFARSRFI